jgi:hypothetical protein
MLSRRIICGLLSGYDAVPSSFTIERGGREVTSRYRKSPSLINAPLQVVGKFVETHGQTPTGTLLYPARTEGATVLDSVLYTPFDALQ